MSFNNCINNIGFYRLFSVYIGSDKNNVTGDGSEVTLPFGNAIYNNGSWNTGTFRFTAPQGGLYNFNGTLTTSGYSGTHTAYEISAYSPWFETYFCSCNPYNCRDSNTTNLTHSFSQSYYMDKGHYILFRLRVTGGSKYVDIKGGNELNNLSCYLIG